MSCTNCFNGCAEIISDKCVKYTGVDIIPLDIHTGDTLLTVENKITEKILTLMDGTGIIPILDPADICEVVQELLPCCPPFNLNDILTVYVKAICILNDKNEALKDRIVVLETAINELNADYNISCLEGVFDDSDTHDVVQAIIDKLCLLEADLQSNYTRTDDLDDFIAAYLAGLPSTGLQNTKMVPNVAYPFFGDISLFGITGAGTGEWDRVFLCNGQNFTPDLRGRVLVGATTMGPPPFNPAVDPALVGNPTWVSGGSQGANSIILNNSQLPSHTHTTVVNITDPGHLHALPASVAARGAGGPDAYSSSDNISTQEITQTSTAFTGLKGTGPGQNVSVTVNPSAGAGAAHSNFQPGTGVNYIMFIPL